MSQKIFFTTIKKMALTHKHFQFEYIAWLKSAFVSMKCNLCFSIDNKIVTENSDYFPEFESLH